MFLGKCDSHTGVEKRVCVCFYVTDVLIEMSGYLAPLQYKKHDYAHRPVLCGTWWQIVLNPIECENLNSKVMALIMGYEIT